MHDFFAQRRPHDGLTLEAYTEHWKKHAAQSLKGLDRIARKYVFYTRYNFERAARVREAYAMSDAFRCAVDAIDEPQLWMVLTEDWCVDSAYSLPVMEAAARRNVHITLRILPRETNLDIMDRYLTNGGRSIPKLVAFTQAGEELFTWGPRPQTLQAHREQLLADGVSGPALSQAVVDWYEEDGWMHVEAELAVRLNGHARRQAA